MGKNVPNHQPDDWCHWWFTTHKFSSRKALPDAKNIWEVTFWNFWAEVNRQPEKKKNIKCFKHHWRRTYGKYMLMIWYGKLQTIDFLGYTVTGEISVFKPVIWYSNGCNSPRKSIQYVCANHILECHLHTWWIPEKIPYNHLISVNIMYIYIYLMTII